MNKQNNLKKIKYGIVILSCLCFMLLSATPSYADDTTPIPMPTATIDYKLPYPGLLPDNPLYFLKSFRDNMMSFFIGKPLDKADFMLLQSDKQVAASAMLVTQNKLPLATTTFAQGQEYFQTAIEQTEAAHKQGVNTEEMAKKLADANRKHFQVLDQMNQHLSEAEKKKFQEAREKENNFAKSVKALQY